MNDAETQSAASSGTRQPLICLVKLMKYLFYLLRGNTDAIIADLKANMTVLCKGPQHDVLFGQRIFVGVVEQVDQRRHQGALVGADLGQIWGDLYLQFASGLVESLTGRA